MGKSLKIGVFFGIPVYVHWSFALLIIYFVYDLWSKGMGFTNILWFVIYVLCVFFCIALHEYGHALTARRYNIKTKDIILSPIGGVARLQKNPRYWYQELLIALAGPSVNIAIFIVGLPIFYFLDPNLPIIIDQLRHPSTVDHQLPAIEESIRFFFIFLVLTTNLLLAIFNLIPAFPMDGGRVLRAVLYSRLSRYRATLIAARIGQALAIIFLAYVFFFNEFNPIHLLIGLFVMFVASVELQSVKYQDWLDQTYVGLLGTRAIRIAAESEIYFDTRRSEVHFWYTSESEEEQLFRTENSKIESRNFTWVDEKMTLRDAIELKKTYPRQDLVLKSQNDAEYYVISNHEINSIPNHYSNRKKRGLGLFRRRS